MKILIVRFSSIGDVVLTTPVVRAVKKQIPDSTVHFLTKENFKSVLANNPYIDKLITIRRSTNEVLAELRAEKYDYIIDLHRNTRTLGLKLKLGRKSYAFPKLNFKKWVLVNFKSDSMPKQHVVDRYFEAVRKLGVMNDHGPCDFFLSEAESIDTQAVFGLEKKTYISIAIGAQFATKRMPFIKLEEIVRKIDTPIVLVGGPTDTKLAEMLVERFPLRTIINACGTFSLPESASIVKQSKVLLSNDTGMMHIASCFETPTVSVWGNTVPALGMYPYFPTKKELFSIHEVNGLSCRPCSKIGFQECPKRHFNCMQLQDSEQIAQDVQRKYDQS